MSALRELRGCCAYDVYNVLVRLNILYHDSVLFEEILNGRQITAKVRAFEDRLSLSEPSIHVVNAVIELIELPGL